LFLVTFGHRFAVSTDTLPVIPIPGRGFVANRYLLRDTLHHPTLFSHFFPERRT
jgi:hypothetical protein